MKSIGEWFELAALYFKVKWFLLKEEREVKRRYYFDERFRRCDRALLSSYIFKNPFHMSKKFLIERGEKEVDLYGETPLTTMEIIARESSLSSDDYLFELGCGRGRSIFFMAQRFGCRAKGIEWVPEFVAHAEAVKASHYLSRVSFSCEDMLSSDLREASAVYLYGTCLKDAEIQMLSRSFEKMKKGSKVITVSFALRDYDPETSFVVCKELILPYPWGDAEVYIQVKGK